MLERWFDLRAKGTTVGTEILAGVTTFMVMAYIIFVNPAILNFSGIKELQGLGPGFAPTLAATCLVAGAMTMLMGLASNYPFAVASGMGLNAVVAFQLIVGMKLPWSAAMGVIFLEGVIITILVLTGFREAVMDAIPLSLKRAIGVGIGLFILFIGLFSGGLVKPGPPGVPVTLGDLKSLPVLVTLIGLFLTVALMALRVKGALLIGILLTTLVAIVVNAASGYTAFTLPGVAVVPSRILAWPDFSTFGRGLDVSIFWRAGAMAAALTIFSIMLADFFDTMGTVIGIAGEAGWLDEKGKLPRLNRILLVDSLAAAFGGFSSASSATTYIESAAGVSEGGRSGLTSVVTGLLFFLALFFSPVAGVVPPQATAAALIVVGYLMCSIVKDIPFKDFEEGFPALMTLVVMPFTYSITNGIGAGFVTYAFIKLIRGKAHELHGMMVTAAVAFVIYFALPWLRMVFGF
ncbi:MAG: xanthine permease [candidate division NC10 bacterium RIFCSPLOWO2_12_FULL_66_18]|nr:MAG: xanthine permease [candidate division NC10 bacterium RIFCSPLOWO2_12_FULL_66_18]